MLHSTAWESGNSVSRGIARRWIPLTLLCMGISLLLSVLNFDAKVSIGGDDSWYVLAALDLWNGVSFPTWHGALYPILLSPLVALFGINLPLIKVISILFTLGAIGLIATAFKGRLHPVAWMVGIAIFSVSQPIIFLASSTYSEPLFMLAQGFVFLTFFRVADNKQSWTTKKGRLALLWLGLSIFLLGLTRNIGYGALIATLLFWLFIRRDWRTALGTLTAFFLFSLPFSLYKKIWWNQSNVSFAGQMKRILQVDFYNVEAGHEDFIGLIVRFAINCKQYLSHHFISFLGVNVTTGNGFLTAFIVLLGIFILFYYSRHPQTIALLGIYLGTLLGITFLTQQVSWSQMRLVVVYLPLLIFFYAGGLLLTRQHALAKGLLYGFIILGGLSVLSNFSKNINNVSLLTLRANLRGDIYAGLTPDWESYLRVSEWAGENIPDSVVVACRKPNNSRIYGERPFFGIFSVPSWHGDTVRRFMDSNQVEYIIVGHLRADPSRHTGRFINSIHFTLASVLREIPDYLELIHHEGGLEPAYLFRIYRDSTRGTNTQYRARMEAGLLVDPQNFEALHKLALLSLEERQPDEAIEYATRGIQLFEHEGEIPPYPLLEVRGIALFSRGETWAAIQQFERSVELYPNEARAWYNLGVAYTREGNPKAQECYARSNSLEGNNTW